MTAPVNTPSTSLLVQELQTALDDILNYWKNTTDDLYGGYVGRINEYEEHIIQAEKGAVLNARIMWSFSAAYNFNGDQQYLELAHRGYLYFKKHFIDDEFGGVYWSVDCTGKPLQTKKQTYAISFAIYGLSEYYLASGEVAALHLARSLYEDLEQHAFDSLRGGYFEALSRNWQPIEDLRLSVKDANESKTMNTHLHVLEGYTNLYRIWPDERLRNSIVALIRNFTEKIIGADGHLGLFFNDNWDLKSDTVSFGHDIEAAWLIQKAAETINDAVLIEETKRLAVYIANVTMKGFDVNGGLNYELDSLNNDVNAEKHWWVQAEAMVGLLNAWQISGDIKFYNQFLAVWQFIKCYIIDNKAGEWFWGVDGDNNRMPGEDKAGFWKCPYHNSRACMELLKRLG